MPIVVNPNPPPRFQVVGRVGFHRGAAQFVDTKTGYLQNPLTQSALGPVERAYNPAIPHQDLRGPGRVLIQAGQDTMRAHHIADSQIQQMVCDYMNGQITLLTLLDRLGVLYLTSWIDVVVTPRLFYIWRQWAHSLVSTFGIALASFRGLAPNQQARLATNLAAALSSSISNLRVGDQQTDAALGQAIAPRLQRGQWDLVGSFVGWLSRYNFAQPTLSVETSLAVAVWGNHFVQHPLVLAAPLQPVNNVFAGRLVNGPILISEQRPAGGARQATIAMPNLYPGTQGSTGYVIRATRATIHLGVIVAILYMMYAAGLLIVSSDS